MALIPQKISERTPASTISGTELVPIVQNGLDKVATVEQLIDSLNPISKHTPEGGFAILRINKTGAPSVKGQSVSASTATAKAVMTTPANGDMPIGVMYEAGIPDGGLCWVVTYGLTEVLFKNTVAPILGSIIFSSDVAGRVDCAATVPNATFHNREHGHCFEAKTGGTNVLAECQLHFN